VTQQFCTTCQLKSFQILQPFVFHLSHCQELGNKHCFPRQKKKEGKKMFITARYGMHMLITFRKKDTILLQTGSLNSFGKE